MTARRHIVVLDAPSNLGLRPPEAGAVPGCYKLPWALRGHGLLEALGAADFGAVVPPRYRAAWSAGAGDRNAEAVAAFSATLADRLGEALEQQMFVVVLGGDCSVLLGNALALKRRGRYGLVFIDGHSDFRHPQNAPAIEAAAGEDLAIVTGRGDARLTDLEGRGPYVDSADIAVLGVRPFDAYLDELRALGPKVLTSTELLAGGLERAAAKTLETVTRATQGFWIHLDLDVLDEQELPAVDSPEPLGLSFSQLTALLRPLVSSPHCVGLEVTIYDPDLDPAGRYAAPIVRALAEACRAVR